MNFYSSVVSTIFPIIDQQNTFVKKEKNEKYFFQWTRTYINDSFQYVFSTFLKLFAEVSRGVSRSAEPPPPPIFPKKIQPPPPPPRRRKF